MNTDIKPAEVEEIIKKLFNTGTSKSKIGIILRDEHGVLDCKQASGKTITEILIGSGLKGDLPEDLLDLIKKSVQINDHLTENRKDTTAKRGYELTVSKIRRLVKYYKKKNILPQSWYYSKETAKLLVK